ncbi:MAG TPA: ribbon-helix-helix domain-containing protein [Desulfobacterales bacterium]|nr:ribbon-helix-helix domain-containing protein [Desulfobacterales bacterium]
MITIKLDPKMKKGIEQLAEKQLVNMSTVIRQAIDKHLNEYGIDWREIPEKKSKK